MILYFTIAIYLYPEAADQITDLHCISRIQIHKVAVQLVNHETTLIAVDIQALDAYYAALGRIKRRRPVYAQKPARRHKL